MKDRKFIKSCNKINIIITIIFLLYKTILLAAQPPSPPCEGDLDHGWPDLGHATLAAALFTAAPPLLYHHMLPLFPLRVPSSPPFSTSMAFLHLSPTIVTWLAILEFRQFLSWKFVFSWLIVWGYIPSQDLHFERFKFPALYLWGYVGFLEHLALECPSRIV
jgi:hypothetical protein